MERIDIYRKEYGNIKLFVVPGGSVESTSLHMARTVCRRLERDLVKAKDEFPVEPVIEQYINRLSSLLFFHSLIAIGDHEITLNETPGHTDGSICVIGEGFILTGDTLFRLFTRSS